MDAAEDFPSLLDAVADDAAAARRALRRKRVDRAFKAVEDVALSREDDLEGFVVFVSTNFALWHVRGSRQRSAADLLKFRIDCNPAGGIYQSAAVADSTGPPCVVLRFQIRDWR